VSSKPLIINLPSDWQVEQFRLTLFPSQPIGDPNNWWKEVMGTEPLHESTQRIGTLPIYQALGPLEQNEGFVTFQHEAGKADWIYGPSPFDRPLPYVTTGPYKPSLDSFRQLVHKLFGYNPPISKRVALGAILIFPVNSRIEGYEFLQKRLPSVTLDAQNSSDFLYRINRRRRLAVSGLEVEANRLSEWQVLQIVSQPIMIGSSYTQTSNEPVVYLARVSVDINTVPEFNQDIDASKQLSLLTEFIRLMEEIATNGDIV
jgi:hypothetical protein